MGADDGYVETVTGLLADPVTRDRLHHHSFVFPDQRLLYVETPKAACTSMKIALLGLTGVALEDLPPAAVPRRFPEAVVHDRRVYPAPSLADLGRPELAEALTAPGWVRFCLVRDPFARTFSAWEDKVLIGDAAMLDRFGPLGEGDRFDDGALDVRATFGQFVERMAERPDLYFGDQHFRPQVSVVSAGVLRYTDIVRLQELDAFASKLESHLGRPIVVPRLNEGLGLPWSQNYDARSIEVVADLYGDDLTCFGFGVPSAPTGPGTRLDPVAGKLLHIARTRARMLAATNRALQSSAP